MQSNYLSRLGGLWEQFGFVCDNDSGKITTYFRNIIFPDENVDYNEFEKRLVLVFKEYESHRATRIELRKKKVVDYYALRNGDFCEMNKAQRRKGLSVALQFQALVTLKIGRGP